VLSPGIIPALNRLVPLLTDKDDSILIMTPSYGPFKKAGEYFRFETVTILSLTPVAKDFIVFFVVDFSVAEYFSIQTVSDGLKNRLWCGKSHVSNPEDLRQVHEMKYDFDEYVSREKTDSLTVDGWREYLFAGQSEFAMRYPAEGLINLWVADMAFATPEPILQAIRDQNHISFHEPALGVV
jgi:hypothetical protein